MTEDDGCEAVPVASSPEKIDLMTDLAGAFNGSEAAKGPEGCVTVRPFRIASGAGMAALAAGWDEALGPRPVVWSPAAAAWGAVLEHAPR